MYFDGCKCVWETPPLPQKMIERRDEKMIERRERKEGLKLCVDGSKCVCVKVTPLPPEKMQNVKEKYEENLWKEEKEWFRNLP